MQIVNVICVGKLKEKYLSDAVKEYVKRLSPFCRFNIFELDEERLPNEPSQSQINSALVNEGKRIIKKTSKGSMIISLCIEGKMLSSTELATKLEQIALNSYSTVDFIIGSSYGLSDEVKNISDFKLSMSKMTFPHQLARVMLCEQIYRAYQILSNGKYHK